MAVHSFGDGVREVAAARSSCIVALAKFDAIGQHVDPAWGRASAPPAAPTAALIHVAWPVPETTASEGLGEANSLPKALLR